MVITLIKRDINVIGFLINAVFVLMAMVYTPGMVIVEDQYMTFWICIILVSFMVGVIHMRLRKGDHNTKMDIVLNSLPMNKNIIVGSRYATIMIYILASSFLVYISSHFFVFGVMVIRHTRYIPIWWGAWIAGINILVYSLYLPIDYYFKERFDDKSELFIVVIIFLIHLARLSMKLNNGIYRYMNNIDFNKFPTTLIIISIITYISSLFISIKIYENTEF